MPLVQFSAENKSVSGDQFPKLKLTKDEQCRINMLKPVPHFEWVHTVNAPKVVNGEAVMETKTRKDDSEYEDYETDFLGRPICLGDNEVISKDGLDAKACPVCAAAAEYPERFDKPVRRFAIPVLKYGTAPGSFKLRTPFSAEVVVWAFTERRFNELTDLAEEWGKLEAHDLQLGPCKNATYQNFDINIAPSAEWQASKERQAFTVETWKENQPKDLAEFCGRSTAKRFMEEDVQKAMARWNVIDGNDGSPDAADTGGAAVDFNDLLNGGAVAEEVPEVADEAAADQADAAEVMASLDTDEAADADEAPVSFEDLLSSLDS